MEELERLDEFSQGEDSGQGNLLGIQPFMRTTDYASEAAFYARLDGYFTCAAQKGWIGARTIATLPEYLGTWLVLEGESPAAFSAPSVLQATLPVVGRHLGSFLIQLLRAGEKNRINASLFRLKAARMAEIYQSVFSRLAHKYNATIAAGSILLPAPQVINGKVSAGAGPLYNTSFLFHPDGRADAQFACKIYPTADERSFVAAAPLKDLPVFQTPAGRLGILVCADSWFPAPYQHLKEQGVELLLVPSAAFQGTTTWEAPWGGYSGWPAPAGVDTNDIGRLSERQAWGKYALAGRFASAGARAGMNIFLYGDLWDMDFSGGQWRLVQPNLNLEGSRRGAGLINLWL